MCLPSNITYSSIGSVLLIPIINAQYVFTKLCLLKYEKRDKSKVINLSIIVIRLENIPQFKGKIMEYRTNFNN